MADVALQLSQAEYDRLITFFDGFALGHCECAKSPLTEDEWIIGGEGESLCEACMACYLTLMVEKGRERAECAQEDGDRGGRPQAPSLETL